MRLPKAAALAAFLAASPAQAATPPNVPASEKPDYYIDIRIWPFASCPQTVRLGIVKVYRKGEVEPYRRLLQFYAETEPAPFLTVEEKDIGKFMLTPGTVCEFFRKNKQQGY